MQSITRSPAASRKRNSSKHLPILLFYNISLVYLETIGVEPTASCLQNMRSTNWTTSPTEKMGFEPRIQYCCICQDGRALSCFSPPVRTTRAALCAHIRLTQPINHVNPQKECLIHWLLEDVLCILWEVLCKKPSALRSIRHSSKLMLTCFGLCLLALPGYLILIIRCPSFNGNCYIKWRH